NPILLKPSGERVSQLVVRGRAVANVDAATYWANKASLWPKVLASYRQLARNYDIIVAEGAGSPAEINLYPDDFVNMGLAGKLDAPVLLVGDIDRGGVFASLYGTLALLPAADRPRVRGLIINKFRGDPAILAPGLRQLEELTALPVLGVIPWLDLDLDDEDSLSPRLGRRSDARDLDVVVLRFPRLANFTDFSPWERFPDIRLRYVERVRDLGAPDLVLLPGSKNTLADLEWLKKGGLAAAVKRLAAAGTPVFGICGGYQMLGEEVADPEGQEAGGRAAGLGLLPVTTAYRPRKTLARVTGEARVRAGFFACLTGAILQGYEIHQGKSQLGEGGEPFGRLVTGQRGRYDGAARNNVAGTYVHGLFDNGVIPERLRAALRAARGLSPLPPLPPVTDAKEREYQRLAAAVRRSLDIRQIYSLLGLDQPRKGKTPRGGLRYRKKGVF
ncbi:MAG: cobyric acid synthase, partial [Planctomycetota bacterium]|nr:cobyric acid synthase [Planctomycetota bacterium]